MKYTDKFVKAAMFFASAVSAMPDPAPKNNGGSCGEPNYVGMAAFGFVSAVAASVYCCFKRCERNETAANAQAFMPAATGSDNYGTVSQKVNQAASPA